MEGEENWQMVYDTEDCQLIYDRKNSRLEVRLLPYFDKNKLIRSVSLGSEGIVKGSGGYCQWLVTPDVRKENRHSLTLPLSILGIEGDVSIRRPGEADNDPSAKCILRVEFEIRTPRKDVMLSVIDIKLLGLRANINMTRLASLYQKLMQYFHDGNKNQKFGTLLYRNKDPQYFDDIERNQDGIMHPSTKDTNGDPTNPLNGRVNGLFFGATLYNDGLPSASPFGTKRFQANIQYLLENLGTWAIYFADFYCMEYTKGIHYVTLVLCRRGSESDQFCRTNLYPLPEQNPVFMINKTGNRFRICANNYAWVEIFYTEAINIREMLANKTARMTDVKELECMMSTGGIPKNDSCPVCNVEPRKWMPVDT